MNCIENQAKDTDIHEQLKEYILPTGFITNHFIMVDGKKGNYIYEDYLREFINASAWFMSKTHGERFLKKKKEDHGENDAVSKAYSIDFKFVLGQSMQKALSVTSLRVSTNKECTKMAVSESEDNKEYHFFYLHKILRGLSKDDIQNILDKKKRVAGASDIIFFQKSMDKKKNLLLFYPAVLIYEGKYRCDINQVLESILDDYGPSLELRQNKHPDKEIYFTFIYDRRFIIALYTEEHLKLVDSVPLEKSVTFNWLCRIYSSNQLVQKIMPSIDFSTLPEKIANTNKEQ